MNKLVLSALAATVVVGTTNADEGEWAGLDAELTALSSSFDSHMGGPSFSGYLEAIYDTDTGAGDSAFGEGRNRLAVSGDNGGYGYYFSVAGESDEGADAYVTFTMGGIGWTMGDFRAATTSNHNEDLGDMHFMDRSALGGGGARTHGLQASGDMSGFGYTIHIGNAEELTYRVSYDVMSGEGVNLSVAYSADDLADTSWLEADVSSGPFGLSFTSGDGDAGGSGDGATCIEATYMVNDTWALGIRQTDQDDGTDETSDWAVTYGDGAARWTFQTNDADDLVIGCIVGF